MFIFLNVYTSTCSSLVRICEISFCVYGTFIILTYIKFERKMIAKWEWLFAWNNRSTWAVIHKMYTGYQTLSKFSNSFFTLSLAPSASYFHVQNFCFKWFLNNWLFGWDFPFPNENYHCYVTYSGNDNDEDEHVVCTLNEIYLICMLSFKFTILKSSKLTKRKYYYMDLCIVVCTMCRFHANMYTFQKFKL